MTCLTVRRYGGRLLGSSVIVALSLASVVAAQSPSQPAVEDFRSAGIHVLFKQTTANDVIAVQVFLHGGSAALTPATAGIENLILRTAILGTRKYTKAQFEASATATGTEVGGTASASYTTFSLRGVRPHWDEAWDLFSEAMLHPVFPTEEVTLARDQLANDLKQRTADPDTYLNMLGDSVTYAGHPFAVDPLGTPSSIARLTSDDLVRWHARRFTKANLLVVAVGNMSREDLAEKIAVAFGDLPASGGGAPNVPPLRATSPSVTIVQRDLPTNYIQGLFVAPSRASRDAPAFYLATRVLSARLFEELRTKRNLTYAVVADFRAGVVSRGTLYVTAVQPGSALRVMMAEVRRIRREPVTVDRLNETLSQYAVAYWIGQQTNAAQAEQLGRYELTGGGWRNGLNLVERMHAVAPVELQRAAQTYMRNVRFVVIGDPKKIDRRLFTSLEEQRVNRSR